ncbi:MAG: MaoC family dehydratase N-terminal domain-containing protein [Pseudomonadales bacterium]|nr:MaoC family dehydratase N-terminal domain-containing protein [Pseudomonadales bacterium]
MPLSTQMVGEQTRPHTHYVDARWLMAYAAGLGDFNPRYMDTDSYRVMAHPVFPVCLEWPVILDSRHVRGYESVTEQERARGVHAAHDLHLYKPLLADESYETTATVVGLQQIRPGAAQTVKLETYDSQGELVCRTWQLSISRDVAVTGEATVTETPPALPDTHQGTNGQATYEIPVAEGLAHVYTETARIWNPIHTDKAFALAAGLPDILLHGTATLALAITRLVNHYAGGDPARVYRLGGQFRQMVFMPSTLVLDISLEQAGMTCFRVLNPDGSAAIENGFFCYH